MLSTTDMSSDFTQQKAKSYSITGFVKNESDGTVRGYQPAVLELMLTHCRSEEKLKVQPMLSRN